MTKIDDDAGRLFDFATANPSGFTFDQVESRFNWGYWRFMKAVRRLRKTLGSDSDGTLPCTPRGMGERWLYQLTGEWERTGPWAHTRLNDAETRLQTIHDVAAAVAQVTDGRSIDGRKARKIAATISYLRGELADISANGA